MSAQGIGFDSLDAGSEALAAAAAAADEAVCVQREALAVLTEGWPGESGSAAIDLVQQHCGQGDGIVAALREAAGVLRSLRDELGPTHDDATDATHDDATDDDATDATHDDARARLAALPAPGFAMGAPPPAQPAPAWPSGPPSPAVANLGGTLAGLVAQIAETLGSYADIPADVPADVPAGIPDEAPVEDPVEIATADPPAARPDGLTAEPRPAAEPPKAEPNIAVPQAESSPRSQPVIDPAESLEPAPEPVPLLAAERPPEPEAPVPAEVAPAEETPCEIAADELPQVGR